MIISMLLNNKCNYMQYIQKIFIRKFTPFILNLKYFYMITAVLYCQFIRCLYSCFTGVTFLGKYFNILLK